MPLQKDVIRSGQAEPSGAARPATRPKRSAIAGPRLRLPGPADAPLLKSPGGALLLRPWFDWVAVRAVARLYLPLSRAWAAALSAGGSCERFWEAISRRPLAENRVAPMLAAVERRRLAYEAAALAWEEAFFDSTRAGKERLAGLELARATAAQNFMAARQSCLPIQLRRRVPPVKWSLPTIAEVEACHGARLASSEAAFPAPRPTQVEVSQRLSGAYGDQHWLRFPTPSRALNDHAWARVYVPRGASDPPTFIFLHGIFMETEMMREIADPVNALAKSGVRVVRPEAPWHGRRRLAGFYGGEPVVARAPLGLLDLFEAWVSEVAVLIDWARSTSRGPVAIGGLSLGALVSQRAAVAARYWPVSLRPDALFLVGTCSGMREVAMEGSLCRELRLPQRLVECGWTDELLMSWRPLMDPQEPPAVPPERIVMLLGSADDLTPFEGGLALAREWGVPEENLFRPWRGHFSVGLGLYRDSVPLQRLLAVLLCVRPSAAA